MSVDHEENMAFEADVRRTAEAVWHQEPGSCQSKHYANEIGISELDGIVRLRDVTHLMMVTTSRRLEKCKDDVKKLNKAEAIERRRGAPGVSKWYITREILNAEHMEYCKQNNVTTVTLHDFRRRFFDGEKYLTRRQDGAFGSARNPMDDSIAFSPDVYVTLPIRRIERIPVSRKGGTHHEVKETLVGLDYVVEQIAAGHVVLLTGPFGAGKSLTTREIFQRLARRYRRNEGGLVPITLNLREHWGQQYFDEILERHARSIAFTPKEDLVVGWRAGLGCLLLDGFDELASQTVVRRDDKNFMKDARREAVRGIRDFLTQLPGGVGVLISGRDHYFDSDAELQHALGLGGRRYISLRLDEFTEDGAKEFLKRCGIPHALPDWIPRKPLFLAYLTRRGLFEEAIKIDTSQGLVWDTFLTRIAEREAQLEYASMDPATMRGVMERLALLARSRPSGNGPITGNDLSEAYGAETGQAASEGVLAQLQRLPGLTQRDQDPGLRAFVDEDMLCALHGSAMARVLLQQFTGEVPNPSDGIPAKSCAMAAHMLASAGTSPETVAAVAGRMKRQQQRLSHEQVIADACAIALHMASAAEIENVDFHDLTVEGASIDELNLEAIHVHGLCLRDCVVRELIIGPVGLGGSLRLEGCAIGKVSGVANEQGLPRQIVAADCSIDEYDSMMTNNAVQQLDIPDQLKALITVLRKLYKQAGAGRKISALHRGITRPEVNKFVDGVVDLLESEQCVRVFNTVVHPVRRQGARMDRILNAPTLSDDPLVKRALKL